MSDAACPCGLGRPYAECCGPCHRGEAVAPTAEALMRSRYAAYVKKKGRYLLDTLHASKRAGFDRGAVDRTFARTRWTGLTIAATTGGSAMDTAGTVTFEAAFEEGGQAGVLRERSRFVREDGRWFYVDGDVS